ncbi:MAG: PadR family transcriptional regulator [Candidatus Sabulitectum sp.]|nr:PadR family transcriptional regulator [Candidatus Sabulitectum sp.]
MKLSVSSTVDRKFSRELSSGITSLALLAILSQAEEPMYGYRIAKEMSSEDMDFQLIKQGALYPVLKSLERNELLSSRVEPSVSGPPRRYYSITDSGREALKRWQALWDGTCNLMNRILGGDTHE